MKPTIFVKIGFEDALRTSAQDGKWLLVDATAEWCGPCKVMDRTTWSDATVIERLDAVAICIQIDVDAERDLAQRLNIGAMPTVIAFHAGVEVDRVVGLQASAQLLSWLDALRRGETSLDALRKQVEADPDDPRVRMHLARALLRSGKLDEAGDEFAWLWQNIVAKDPAMIGVKHSYLVNDLRELVSMHPRSRDRFHELRQQLSPADGAAPDPRKLQDWFSLNDVLGESAAGLAWYDGAAPEVRAHPSLTTLFEQRVLPLLVEADRWADVGALYVDPLQTLTRAAELRTHADKFGPNMPPEAKEQFRAYAIRELRRVAGQIVRGLRAAERADEATRVEARARELDDSPEMDEALSLSAAARRTPP
jgi:thiol-disulfide isomerase/thioredoxin